MPPGQTTSGAQLPATQWPLPSQTLPAAHCDEAVQAAQAPETQPLVPGQIAVTVTSGSPVLRLVAALPGEYRPQLQLRHPAWLELQGYTSRRTASPRFPSMVCTKSWPFFLNTFSTMPM